MSSVNPLFINNGTLHALSDLFEGRNINRRMTLRNHLKSVKAQKSKTMQSCFTRVSLLSDKSTQADSSRISLVQVDLEQIKYIT